MSLLLSWWKRCRLAFGGRRWLSKSLASESSSDHSNPNRSRNGSLERLAIAMSFAFYTLSLWSVISAIKGAMQQGGAFLQEGALFKTVTHIGRFRGGQFIAEGALLWTVS